MINMLRSDLYKMFKSKSFYMCLMICVVFAIVMPFLLQLSMDVIKQAPQEVFNNPAMQQIKGGSIGINMNTITYQGEISAPWLVSQLYSGNVFALCIAILTSIFITAEFSNGTMKTIASKRNQ